MDDAIEASRLALGAIAARLVALLALGGPEGALRRIVLALLRPAEAALRRLALAAAAGLEICAPAAPGRAQPDRPFAPPENPSWSRLPLVPLCDRLPPASRGPSPRLSVIGVIEPDFAPRGDGRALARRVAALAAALADLPRQARRVARWRRLRAAGRFRRLWPLRPGPPRREKSCTGDVAALLATCHRLALAPDTS